VNHEEAWQLLPDLLEDRDDPELLGHVRSCAECQRRLFLLGRVDRMLRDRQAKRPRRFGSGRIAVAGGALAAAVAATIVLLVVPGGSSGDTFTLRTASGRTVGSAVMRHSDARNVSLAFSARGLLVGGKHVFVLWAGGDGGAAMEVGRFMVDRTGGCRAHFNLPATHDWYRFWVAEPGNAAAVLAST
jgi:hypothetical protein